jgi:hypothetical protein
VSVWITGNPEANFSIADDPGTNNPGTNSFWHEYYSPLAQKVFPCGRVR